MKTTSKASSAEDFKLQSEFEEIRKTLLEEKYADRLDKPLAYWALPNDRRLPLAFLGRTLGELLQSPFEDLSATPGIGQKKINSLVKLLHRATKDAPPTAPFGMDEREEAEQAEKTPAAESTEDKFDPSLVSEALWAQWRETVRQHDVGREKLGRLAPTLQSLPTVIWHTPLNSYLELSLSEIRRLKTHGEKRVRVVLEVFYVVHKMLSGATTHERLAIRLAPNFVPPLDDWLDEVLERRELPSVEEIRDKLARPLLGQIQIDAGTTVHKLAEGRLGVDTAPQSVRLQSRRMGVTRARVYQLLDDCSKVMDVRWPEGKCRLGQLAKKFEREGANTDSTAFFSLLRELFYPEKYDHLEEPVLG